MRILLADQDTQLLESLARAIRNLCVLDTVTTKVHCLDLLRSNEIDLVIAGERLADGSGLELLGQIAKRWPWTLRVFAAEPPRLAQLRGRLGPFQLYRVMRYPIVATELRALIEAARTTRAEAVDTLSVRHIVLEGETASESAEGSPGSRCDPPPNAAQRAVAATEPPRSRATPPARAGNQPATVTRANAEAARPRAPAPTKRAAHAAGAGSTPPDTRGREARESAAVGPAPGPTPRRALNDPEAAPFAALIDRVAAAEQSRRPPGVPPVRPNPERLRILLGGLGLAMALYVAVLWMEHQPPSRASAAAALQIAD